MTERPVTLISFGAAVLAAIAWPELQSVVGYLPNSKNKPGTLSGILLLLYLVLMLITKSPKTDPKLVNGQSPYVRVFVMFFFLLGLASIMDANPTTVPVVRGIGAFFHVVSLWGAAMIVADLIRTASSKFFTN